MQSRQYKLLPSLNQLLQPSLKWQPLISLVQRRLQKYGMVLSEVDFIFNDNDNASKRAKAFSSLTHAKTYYEANAFDIDPSLLIDQMFEGESYSWQSIFSQHLINNYFNTLQYDNIPYRIVIQKTIDDMTVLLQYNYTIDMILPLQHQNQLIEISKIASDHICKAYLDQLKAVRNFAYLNLSDFEKKYNLKPNSTCFKEENLIDFYNAFNTDQKLAPLSKKQKEIAKLAYEGCTIKEMAYKLNIAQSTAIDYLNTIKSKLGTHSKSLLIQRLHHSPFLFSA
ncbi:MULTISPECIES: helix-turn-helix transcriptional regulator [Cysteiniphilum]|uniref:helix-turn-helix transcriptional regulator n=1 Tax=Cysteiniphilum TaxID=2056696 RepID=UPI00177FC27A|nr:MULTISPECIES: helix-turn-helix transcriptional regulator [Cysteiniphilum]